MYSVNHSADDVMNTVTATMSQSFFSGLTEPVLIRLDVDSKLSDQIKVMRLGFIFTDVLPSGALYLLRVGVMKLKTIKKRTDSLVKRHRA